MNIKTNELRTDVLVIGGGTAGCLAAMAAKQKGCDVTLVEKGGSIRHSGSLATGVDHYSAILGEGPWDTPEAFVNKFASTRPGITDLKVVSTYAKEARKIFGFLEEIGVNFKDAKTGKYYRIAGLGGRDPHTICFEGGRIKDVFSAYLGKLQVRLLERLAVEGLLISSGRVTGAVGFHIRTGDFYIIRAKSVVLGTGGATRLFPSPTGRDFFTHAPPFNTGDGHVIALRAGADLTNMEFTFCSVSPRGSDSPAITGFIGMGATFVNARGERFMEKSHPLGDHAPRTAIVNNILKECAEGRGPCFVDCRHLGEEAIGRITKGILNERPTLMDFLKHKDLDMTRDLIPYELREMETQGQGIKVDENCCSTVEGLFAAGDCTNVGLAVSGACTLGYVAGEKAVKHAAAIKDFDDDLQQVNKLRDTIYYPITNPGNIRPIDVEDEMRRIMSTWVGFNRNADGLKTAIKALKGLKDNSRAMMARSFHELMRANETRNLIDVAIVIATAALERKESRSLPAHSRTDYPRQDDEHWKGYIIVNRGDGEELKLSYQPLKTAN
ncbi:MAG: FAD-dependent oxidoreductase [Dehalococcoidia bacterium]|nr:FAD-dependent oxidoreductase [Dehalococcoidia bacterium]